MQLRNSLCAILILLLTLSQVAFATLEYAADGTHLMASSRIAKRANVLVKGGFVPRLPGSQPSKKRQQTCPPVTFACSDGIGCCKLFSILVKLGHLLNLNTVNNSRLLAGLTGTTCSVDEGGTPVCSPGGGGDTTVCTTEGYIPCTNMDGCCPAGVTCSPDDPPCGENRCCPKGEVCLSGLSCGAAPSFSSTSLSTAEKTVTSTVTESPSETLIIPEASFSALVSISEQTVTSTVIEGPTETPIVHTKISVTYTAGGAPFPTADAILGGALGIAAGYLAM